MLNILKHSALLMRLYGTYKFFGYVRRNTADIGWIDKLRLLRQGFFPNRAIVYDFDQYSYGDYVTDFQENVKTTHINKAASRLIQDKLVFPNLIAHFVDSPSVLAVIQQGVVVPYGSYEPGISSKDSIITYLKETGPLVLKPVGGDGGIGIIKVQYMEDDIFEVNQESRSPIDLYAMLNGLNDYLVSTFVVQASYATKIYPLSVNTVRILTMIDPITRKPFIAAAAHRIGNDYSYPVDNCGRGGFTAQIDIETGCLGKAVSVKRFTKELEWHSHHPDSGQLIEGVFVPAWTELKMKVLQMADAMPFSPYLGWDVVVTDNGFTVLEANDGPDLKLHQVHKPLLLDERVKQFYATHKVI